MRSDLSRLASSIKGRPVNPRTSHRTMDVVLGFLQVHLDSFGATFETAAEQILQRLSDIVSLFRSEATLRIFNDFFQNVNDFRLASLVVVWVTQVLNTGLWCWIGFSVFHSVITKLRIELKPPLRASKQTYASHTSRCTALLMRHPR